MTTKNLISRILSSLFLLTLLTLINSVKAYGQVPTPDCVVFVNIMATAGSGATVSMPVAPYFNNRTVGCQSWTFQYQVVVTSGSFTNISVQSASGGAVAGSFSNWSGTVATGINPNTNQAGAVSTFTTGCIASTPCTTPNSFIRVLLTRNTFVGSINGVLYGYKSGYPGGGGSGGGGSGCTSPCPVVGTAAAGMAPSGAPVQVGGTDGTDIRTILTDSTGALLPAGASSALADGISNTENSPGVALSGGILYYRSLPFQFNGTTWDRQFVCTSQAPITITAGTDVVLVAGVSSTIIRVCHIDWASDTQATFTIRQGTGSTCGTNTATLAGAYPLIVNFFANYEPVNALRTTVAARDLCLHSSASATVGGWISYAQY